MLTRSFIMLAISILICWKPGIGQATISKPELITKSTYPGWYFLKQGTNISAEKFFDQFGEQLGLGVHDRMQLEKTEKDRLGFHHYRFQQLYKDIPVEGGEFLLHEKNGHLQFGNGKLIPGLDLDPVPAVAADQSVRHALKHINATSYMWEDPQATAMLRDIKNDPDASFYPVPELVLMSPGYEKDHKAYRLAWKMDVFAAAPMSRQYVYVDAKTGEIFQTIDRIHTGEATGIAETKYSGTQTIITDSISPNQFILRESSRGGGIETYDMNTGTSYGSAVDFYDSDNYWNNVNAEQDEAATDAHWATEVTYDYYLQKHSLDSYDGNGSKLISYVHYDQNYANAFWNGSWMTYGDGSAGTTAFTSLDIGVHEVTHGVTEFSAGLVYLNEPGALNESFSDLFAAAAEFWADSANADWRVGEDVTTSGNGLRSMSSPNIFQDPDTYQGFFWKTGTADNGGVHSNSGVQNFWFYLLARGGSGTNDNNDAYNVTGIGIEKAAAIAYRNLSTYLTSTSEYFDARTGAIQAAEDLYGQCSPEVISTAEAWFAVGVGNPIADDDLWLLELESPKTSCGLSNAEPVTIKFRYNGCSTPLPAGLKVPFTFQLDGGPQVSDTVTLSTPMNGGDTLNHTFNTTMDLSSIGDHSIKLWSAYAADPEKYNDSLDVHIESKLQQNTDVGVVDLISPKTGCNLTGEEEVKINIQFNGCDLLPKGTDLEVKYQLDGQNAVTETVTVPHDVDPGETLIYAFDAPLDLSTQDGYLLDVQTAYTQDQNSNNDALNGNVIKHPYTLMDKITFTDTVKVADSVIFLPNTESDVYVFDSAAHNSDYGLIMTGGDIVNYTGDLVIPTEGNIWQVNEPFSAKACFCVDASRMSTVLLSFDLKQTYSILYSVIFGIDSATIASSFRILANGNQVEGTFNPSTNIDDPFVRHEIILDDYANSTFELCFETRNYFSWTLDPWPNSQGDNAFVDNIEISGLPNGIAPNLGLEDGLLSVVPNPAHDFVTLRFTTEIDESLDIILTDLPGRALFRETVQLQSSDKSLDIAHLPPGIYLIHVSGDSFQWTDKVVLVR